jgi:hypothetical protein
MFTVMILASMTVMICQPLREKEYQNDHDAGYTYIDPDTGKSYPLTPQLMKECCQAMVGFF